jgi:hypothetical protein
MNINKASTWKSYCPRFAWVYWWKSLVKRSSISKWIRTYLINLNKMRLFTSDGDRICFWQDRKPHQHRPQSRIFPIQQDLLIWNKIIYDRLNSILIIVRFYRTIVHCLYSGNCLSIKQAKASSQWNWPLCVPIRIVIFVLQILNIKNKLLFDSLIRIG